MSSATTTALDLVGIVKPSDEGGFTGDLVLKKLDDDVNWELQHHLTYVSNSKLFPPELATVPKCTTTDLASVPQFFTWLVPTYGTYTKAAVLHDWMCESSKKKDRYPTKGERANVRFEADLRFREIMQASGVALPRRWFMWAAVTWATVVTRWTRALPMLLVGTLTLLALVPPYGSWLVRTVGWVLEAVPLINGTGFVRWLAGANWELGAWAFGAVAAWLITMVIAGIGAPGRVPRLILCCFHTAVGMWFLVVGAGLAAVVIVEQRVERWITTLFD